MLTIRLTRKGKKNQPFFKIVVIDKRRSSKGGRAVDILGFVDPIAKRKSIDKEKVLRWIKNGAQPSPTMHNLLVSEKIIEGTKTKVFNISKKKKAEIKAAEDASKAAAATPKEEPQPLPETPAGDAKPATPEGGKSIAENSGSEISAQ